GRQRRSRRREARILLLEHTVLVQDTQERAVVCLLPVAPRSLPLLHNRLDGRHRRGKVGDGDQRWPAEILLGGLGLGWTYEDTLPPPDRLHLRRSQALTHVVLEAEGGKQVFAHDHVLELRRFAEHVDQLFPVFDHNRAFHGCLLWLASPKAPWPLRPTAGIG